MIFLEDTTTTTPDDQQTVNNWWSNLWQKIVDFFSIDNTALFAMRLALTIIVLIIAFLLVKLNNFLIAKFLNRRKKNKETGVKEKIPVNYSVLYFSQSVMKVIIYILAVIIILTIFGVNFAGLGTILAGAVAGITLCLQDLISALSYGIIILTSNEFNIGDYIIIQDGPEGTVKRISLLYTILVSLTGETIYIPNNVVGKAATVNTSTEKVRCIRLSFDVPNGVDFKKVKELALSIANEKEKVFKSPEPYLVIDNFKDESITLSLRMYCANADYWNTIFQLKEDLYTRLPEVGARIGREPIRIEVKDSNKEQMLAEQTAQELEKK